ncbi:FecR family protein [Pseudomonas huaxiensis]|uniref:FecR family protein n=1 Tax=Pseudomonas huaxiensis TaxID=2213017 RepID=UPI000DA6CBB2|nr:FecR domain-containing protein [Pseudomonas huaxiensis]
MSSVREQAARWFTRLMHLPDDHPERQRLRQWLDADPRHAAEYQAFCDLWGDFSSTASTQALAGELERQHGRRTVLRRGALGLLGLLAVGLTWRLFGGRGEFAQTYVTAIGERRRERLPDGSELYLDADTRLRVQFDQGRRQVWLLQGQAIFDVAHDAARTFAVDAGLARVSVLGTRFVVARDARELRVSVERGSVRVDNAQGALVLKAGQVASTLLDRGPTLLPITASNAFAFAQGRLVLEQASVEEIASSLSRYRRQPVQVRPGKGRPAINAVVQLDDIEGFLQALPSIAPIEVSHAEDVTWLRAL